MDIYVIVLIFRHKSFNKHCTGHIRILSTGCRNRWRDSVYYIEIPTAADIHFLSLDVIAWIYSTSSNYVGKWASINRTHFNFRRPSTGRGVICKCGVLIVAASTTPTDINDPLCAHSRADGVWWRDEIIIPISRWSPVPLIATHTFAFRCLSEAGSHRIVHKQ